MDKSFIVFIAIGIGFLYFVTNFVGDIQKEDEAYRNDGFDQEHMYDKYQSADSIGREILDVTGASATMQVTAWDNSQLKVEFLTLFPSFAEMKVFAQERVRGVILQEKLSQAITAAEDAYFSGSLTAEGAKRALGSVK